MKSGVYRITCTRDGRVYIGQSTDIQRRWRFHKSRLNRKMHANPLLQAAWDKYGQEAFRFDIITKCQLHELDLHEKHWVAKYQALDPMKGFNQAEIKIKRLTRKKQVSLWSKVKGIVKGVYGYTAPRRR